MPVIEDGRGRGYLAEVDSEQKLRVSSVSETLEHFVNETDNEAYHLVFQQTPIAANAEFLYILNSHPSKVLIIEGVWIRSGGNERIGVYLASTGTPTAGVDATPVNNYAGSANAALGTFQTGNNIGGLTLGSLVERLYVPTGNESKMYNFEQDIILPTNQTFVLSAEVGSLEIDGTVVFHYH